MADLDKMLDEAAKQYPPPSAQASTQAALPSSSDDSWKIWSQSDTEPAAKPQGLIERASNFAQEHPYITTAAGMIPGVGSLVSAIPVYGEARTKMAPGMIPSTVGIENGVGALKTGIRDAYGLIANPMMGPGGALMNFVGDKTGLTNKVQSMTEPTTDLQRGGGYAMDAAELALPLPKIAGMIPNAERAGEKFNTVQNIMKGIPVNIDAAAPSALRAEELAKTKSFRPPVMKDILKRLAPGAIEPTFRESTDLGTNVGKLSAQETMRMKGPMGGQVKQMAKALSEANQAAADKAGVGDLYKSAVDEYRRAKTIEQAVEVAKKYAKGALGAALLGGAAAGAGWKVYDTLSGNR